MPSFYVARHGAMVAMSNAPLGEIAFSGCPSILVPLTIVSSRRDSPSWRRQAFGFRQGPQQVRLFLIHSVVRLNDGAEFLVVDSRSILRAYSRIPLYRLRILASSADKQFASPVFFSPAYVIFLVINNNTCSTSAASRRARVTQGALSCFR